MEEDKRHFIVIYFGSISHGTITGYIEFTTFDKSYLNKETTLMLIQKTNANMKDIVITNIIELSESDFKDWTNKD